MSRVPRRLARPLAALALALAPAALPLGGCVVSIGGGGGAEPSAHMSQPGAHGPRCADIELSRSIEFSGPRADAQKRIAALADLTEHEQLFLVDTVAVSEGFSSNKTDVLVVLARNPALTQAARERISLRVPRADLFSSDVERISQALLSE
ncbi:MAG TPA: hypothetical protein VFD43_06155 [Planctomycetota bacterium]|nr:hypothetical protein [Planctomycetota bacterium]